MSNLFLGLTLNRRPEWESYFSEVAATRSSKPDSVAKEIAEKRAKREEQAHYIPVAGTVVSCVLLDEDGRQVFLMNAGGPFDNKPGEISYIALQAIRDTLFQADGSPFRSASGIGATLFGLKIRDRIRIMALDAMRFLATAGENRRSLPAALWYHRPFDPAYWCDPYEAIVPSEHRNDIPYDGLCSFLGIELPAGAQPDSDAELQAQLAWQITTKAGLLR